MTARAAARTVLAGAVVLAVGLASRPATAQPMGLVTDLSEHLISITSSFAGTDLLLFGAIEGGAGDIVVVVRGPEQRVVIRRKEHAGGIIWINRRSREFRKVPGYYAVAASRPLADIVPDHLAARLQLGAERLRFAPVDKLPQAELGEFSRAIVRAKMRDDLYRAEIAKVSMLGETLFRSRVQFPANVPVGDYSVDVYLLREGQVVGAQTTPLFVKKFGVERQIFDFAHRQPLIYGIAAVCLALAAGWAAGVIFRRP